MDHRKFFKTKAQGIPDTRTLLDHYEDELRKIGYEHTADDRPVTNSNNTPLHHLIFGSKNKLGKTLREAMSQKTLSGTAHDARIRIWLRQCAGKNNLRNPADLIVVDHQTQKLIFTGLRKDTPTPAECTKRTGRISKCPK